jgi:glycosyltransferase involved in cell wall biosynthesis
VGPEPGRIFTICNGVDPKLFERRGDRQALCDELGVRADSRLILTVGRLTEQKGLRYLLDAAAPVVSLFPDSHFLLVGEGELFGTLTQQAARNGVPNQVHLMGVRRDVPDLLAAVDIFVLPSLWEGLSVALLEAMAAAKPIVATTVSGTLQAMIPDNTGLLVPPGDSRALANAIVQLLSDPLRAQRMGQSARQHVEKYFSAHQQASQHLALYRDLLHMEDSR